MNNSKILIVAAVVLAVVGGVYLISDSPAPADNKMDAQMAGDNATSSEEMNLEGIHIMADGSVMLGNGETVENAKVTEEGMIELPDGQVVEPVMDMRESGSMEDMDGMENMEGMNN